MGFMRRTTPQWPGLLSIGLTYWKAVPKIVDPGGSLGSPLKYWRSCTASIANFVPAQILTENFPSALRFANTKYSRPFENGNPQLSPPVVNVCSATPRKASFTLNVTSHFAVTSVGSGASSRTSVAIPRNTADTCSAQADSQAGTSMRRQSPSHTF